MLQIGPALAVMCHHPKTTAAKTSLTLIQRKLITDSTEVQLAAGQKELSRQCRSRYRSVLKNRYAHHPASMTEKLTCRYPRPARVRRRRPVRLADPQLQDLAGRRPAGCRSGRHERSDPAKN